MAEQRFGIFGKDVTRYIPPELRPFTKLAVDMNPVTGFQRAGRALKRVIIQDLLWRQVY